MNVSRNNKLKSLSSLLCNTVITIELSHNINEITSFPIHRLWRTNVDNYTFIEIACLSELTNCSLLSTFRRIALGGAIPIALASSLQDAITFGTVRLRN